MSLIRMMKIWKMAPLLSVLSACGTGEAGEAPNIQSVAAWSGDLLITVEAPGNVEPIRKVEVKSKASGEILRLYVDIGDEVELGALLAEIDPRDVRNAFAQADADLEVAQARIDISKAQLGRSQELLESGVISVQEHETRNLDFANAQATLIKARTNLELAQLRLADVTIRAPIAGTILEKNVEEGQVIQSASQNISAGTTLFFMANLDVVQVRALVDESDMGEILDDMAATVEVEAYPGETFAGVVEKIEPQAVVQQNVTMFPVIVRLDNSARLLRPGMNTMVEIEIAEAPGVLLIPNNAVVTPQDAGPAALVLGLDADAVDMRSMFAGGRGGGHGARPERGRDAGTNSGSEGGQASNGQDRSQASRQPTHGSAESGQSPEHSGRQDAFDSRRAPIAGGDVSRDLAQTPSTEVGQRHGAGGGGFGMRQHEGGLDTAGPPRAGRPAVVFVIGEDGTVEPRMVMIGLNDWDNTQIVSGLDEGERVALIGLAQLQARQDQFLDRIRSRSSPFGGGMGAH